MTNEIFFERLDVVAWNSRVGRVLVDTLIDAKRRVQPGRYWGECRSEYPQHDRRVTQPFRSGSPNLVLEEPGIQKVYNGSAEARD